MIIFAYFPIFIFKLKFGFKKKQPPQNLPYIYVCIHIYICSHVWAGAHVCGYIYTHIHTHRGQRLIAAIFPNLSIYCSLRQGRVSHWALSWVTQSFWLARLLWVPVTQHHSIHDFLHGWHLNSGCHACIARSLPTEPSSSPRYLRFNTVLVSKDDGLSTKYHSSEHTLAMWGSLLSLGEGRRDVCHSLLL